MKINLQLSAVANFLAILNAANPGKNFSESNITLGAPAELTGGTGGRNTSIELTAVQDQGFSGVHTVNYKRPELAVGKAIATAKAVPVLVQGTDTDAEILTKVAGALGLLESELTVSNVTIPANENDTTGRATITAKAASLLYVGDYTVELDVADTDVPLDEAITTSDLDGFDDEE